MDEIRIRELPQKNNSISLSDLVILEDADGTKTVEASSFKSLIQQSIFYDTVEDMKSATLKEGDIIKTLGYWEKGDGGGAYYEIVYAPTDLDDGVYVHYLHTSDTLRAHYIMDEFALNSMQFGARGNGTSDDYGTLQKAINAGSEVTFVKRSYRLTGSLEVPSNTIVDLNGATIICASSAAFSVGLNSEAKNIIIKNGNIRALNGIELHSKASEINISNCNFTGSKNVAMSTAISVSGASNVKISDITFGTADSEVRYGINISNGPGENNKETHNQNIQISNVSGFASVAGVSFSGTYVDKNISVNDLTVEGYGDRTSKNIYGVLVSCSVDSLVINSVKLKNLTCGAMVSGIISSVVSFSDVTVDECDFMYNLASAGSTVYLGGLQQFSGNKAGTAYVFDRITSNLVMQGEFDVDRSSTGIKGKVKNTTEGEVFDTVNPVGKKKMSITSLAALNNKNSNNPIPPYKNVSLNLEFSGNIESFDFPSLSGQVIAVYSDNANCKLVPSTKIKVNSEITLSRYEPVVLKNTSGIWYMVQFGGDADTSGGSSKPIIDELEPLVLKTNGNLAVQYNGFARRELDITPNAIGAAEKKHTHPMNEILGAPVVPPSLKNPFSIIVKLDSGTTEGTDQFTYDGSKQVIVDIPTTGTGGVDPSELNAYGKKANFTGTGSFSVNRKDSTEKGTNSVAMGTTATATGNSSIAIGNKVTSNGTGSVAEGSQTTANGEGSHAEGYNTTTNGKGAHAEGVNTAATNDGAHAEGQGTFASSSNQHVEGRYNVEDKSGTYAHITGGGNSASNRKNIYTLDWSGNAVYSGKVSGAEPTENSNFATKHYADTLNSASTTRINTNKENLANLISSLGPNMMANGGTVTDWDKVYQNGFVVGFGAKNSPPSCEVEALVGICLSRIITSNKASSSMIIAFPISRLLSTTMDADNNVTLYAYVRQMNDNVWGSWYKINLGTGKVDVK